jgi:hypothetical protein
MSCGYNPQKQQHFMWENKLAQDRCALAQKQRDNDSLYEYNTFNYFLKGENCQTVNQEISCFAADYPNLHFREGYGISSCVVDEDSKLRYEPESLTHGRERQSLNTRLFQAVPNFGRGGLVANTDTYLKNGMDTTYLRECDRLTERNFDRFYVLSECAVEQAKVPYLLSPGADSRQLWRQQKSQQCQKK